MIDRAAHVAPEHGQSVAPAIRRRSPVSERSDLDPSVDADRLEQPPVVGDEDDRALERVQRLLELLDGGQVEMVGRLVEHEAVDARGP